MFLILKIHEFFFLLFLKQVLEKVAQKPQTSEGKAIHRWTSCNGCGMNPIVGKRYQCNK